MITPFEIKCVKTRTNARLPFKATSFAAGSDLYIADIADMPKGRVKCYTGISMEIPEGYVGLLFPRSSIHKTNFRLANSVGVIDSDYRGEISAVFDTKGVNNSDYKVGDRCCQIVIVPILNTSFKETTEELSSTKRGDGGYGSTGK